VFPSAQQQMRMQLASVPVGVMLEIT